MSLTMALKISISTGHAIVSGPILLSASLAKLVFMANFSQCQTASGDGCGRVFSRKVSPGLCVKCSLLSTHPPTSPEYESIKRFQQCKDCGGAWKNFEGTVCDACNDAKAVPGPSVLTEGRTTTTASDFDRAQHAVELSKLARSQAMDVRMKKKKPEGRPDLLTTEGLNLARAASNVAPAFDEVQIAAEVRFTNGQKRGQNTIDPNYGRWGRAWKKTTYLSEVLDHALVVVNATWDKSHNLSLERSHISSIPCYCHPTNTRSYRNEVEFRWAGNKVFHPGTQNLTVGEVYETYMIGKAASFYAPPEKLRKTIKGPAMFLEVCVDKFAYEQRTDALGSTMPVFQAKSSKRSTRHEETSDPDESDDDSISVAPKRSRHLTQAGGLRSTFVRSTVARRNEEPDPVKTIRFVRVEALVVEDTGEVEVITRPEASETSEYGTIGILSFARGATKEVYKLTVGENLYVAKRFFDTGTDSVSSESNLSYLQQELTRLKLGQWFWKKFVAHAKEMNVAICEGTCANCIVFDWKGLTLHLLDIHVSNGFLIKILDDDTFSDHPEAYLVEPRRSKSVLKFSGTLQHPIQSSKMGNTLTAFAHYVFEISGKDIVFADIQGSPISVNGRDGVVLFDLMSHSNDGTTGVGDHGKKGIKAFVTQHECNSLCNGLKMAAITDNTV
ncbi:hypothetical protein H0H93_009077 [Arthromyces matolae]|nr:hypothetical protein H0H93_009077 [Arthromyces matolae]